jgi:hypothetical protein
MQMAPESVSRHSDIPSASRGKKTPGLTGGFGAAGASLWLALAYFKNCVLRY